MPYNHHRASANYKADSSSSSSSSKDTEDDISVHDCGNRLPSTMQSSSLPSSSCSGDATHALPFPTIIPNNINRRATVSGVPLIPSSLAATTTTSMGNRRRRLVEGAETLHEGNIVPTDKVIRRSVSICEDNMVYDIDTTRRRQSNSSLYYYQRLRRDSQTSTLTQSDCWGSCPRFTTASSEIGMGLKGRALSTLSQYSNQRQQQQEDDEQFHSPPPVSPYYRDSTYWLKIVIVLSICKGFIEAGLRSSYVNEVSAYGQHAIVRGMLMLAIEALVCMFYPIIHRWFELNTQAKFLLLIGGFGSSFHIYYLVYGAATSFRDHVVYILACCIAAFLYPLDVVGSYIIIGRSGYFCCRDPTRLSGPLDSTVNSDNNHNSNPSNPNDDNMGGGEHGHAQFRALISRNMSLFFGLYFFSYVGAGLLNIALGLIFTYRNKNVTETNESLLLSFWISGMFSILGSTLYLALPPCPKSDVIPGTPIPETSLLKTILFPIVNRKYSLFGLFVFACGMVEGILYGDVILCLVNPILGGHVGNLIAGYVQIIEGIIAFSCGLILYKTGCRKRYVILLATITVAIGIILFSYVIFSFDFHAPAGSFERPNYKLDLDNPGSWLLVEKPTPQDYFIVFSIVGIIAIGEALYKSQLPVILNTIFQDTKYHMVANANIKGLRCLGYATQLAISISMTPATLESWLTSGDHQLIIIPLVTLILVVIAYIPISISWSRSCIHNRGFTLSSIQSNEVTASNNMN